MGRPSLVILAVMVATAAGCGSSESPVRLEGSTESTGGKALSFAASTDKKLGSAKGGIYALELRGIDSESDGASFEKAGYIDKKRCIVRPCEWTVVPGKASTYEFKAFLIDLRTNTEAGNSDSVKLDWTAPPRPRSLKLFVNGKTPPTTPLDGEDYSDFPAGPLQVQAKWATDAGNSGYYVKISIGDKTYARCSAGTSCRVPKAVPLAADKEMSWVVELLTARGDKVVDGFKVCLEGAAESETA